jgi:4-hydroxy-2-oxoheptanedioate aldolase
MRTNQTKQKLQAGETVLGCWFRYTDASLVEFVAYQGWDFVVFDGEHGPLEPRDCENAVRAAELRGVTPLVRVAANEAPLIQRYLDTGAQGAHIPMVSNGREAELAVSSVKYGPRGNRGLAPVRAADFGQNGPLQEYVVQANRQTLVVAQIETPEAIDELSEIIAVDGIDVVFVGPSDLSQALGVPGQLSHPDVEHAVERIVRTVAASDCVLGVFATSGEAARAWRERGARYIATSLEALVVASSTSYFETLRR